MDLGAFQARSTFQKEDIVMHVGSQHGLSLSLFLVSLAISRTLPSVSSAYYSPSFPTHCCPLSYLPLLPFLSRPLSEPLTHTFSLFSASRLLLYVPKQLGYFVRMPQPICQSNFFADIPISSATQSSHNKRDGDKSKESHTVGPGFESLQGRN